jgi:hypothetical protein
VTLIIAANGGAKNLAFSLIAASVKGYLVFACFSPSLTVLFDVRKFPFGTLNWRKTPVFWKEILLPLTKDLGNSAEN